jgi:hypothetical protein
MFADVELSGSFLTPASGNANQTLQLPFVPDLIEIWIQGNASGDNWTSSANPGPTKYAFWQKGMANGTALATANTAGAATDTSVFLASGGITPVVSAANLYGPQQAGSGITKATPAVMTLTNSNVYNTGDVVLLEATTGALQFSGIPWAVVKTGATTYNLGISGNAFSSAAFAAAATNVVTQKVLYPGVFTPYISYITAITFAGSTVPGSSSYVVLSGQTGVTTSFPHGLSVGDSVRLIIPAPWGATQISGQQGIVTAVPDAITFAVAINSSAASAFVFPTTAQAAAGVTWPQVVPFGDQASAFDMSATDNDFQGIIIGNSATVGAAILSENSALVLWRAQKSARVYTSLVS